MKRTILNITGFTVFFIAFYSMVMLLIAVSTVFTFDVEKFFFKYLHFGSYNDQRAIELDHWLAEDKGQTTGLITGSSSICLNINPHILTDNTGIDFFMAGNDGQPISISLTLLKYCLGSGKKIDYFILGIDPVAWNMKDEGSALEWIVTHPDPYKRHLFEMAINSGSRKIAIIYSYLLVKRLLPFSKYLYTPPSTHTHYIGKGYGCSQMDRAKIPFEDSVHQRIIKPINYNSALEIIQICRENNIKLIMLKPKLVNFYGKADTLDKTGAIVIDANAAPVDTSLYFDNYHMYCDGGTVYSQWIAGEINKIIAGHE